MLKDVRILVYPNRLCNNMHHISTSVRPESLPERGPAVNQRFICTNLTHTQPIQLVRVHLLAFFQYSR